MQLDLTEDQTAIRDAVRDLCEREFAPHAAEWDQTGDVPHAAVMRLADEGFLGMAVPEEWGGLGYDARTIATVIEEISRVSASLAIMIAVHNSVGLLPVYKYATDEQKKRFLPRLVSKELSAFSLSEPGAGSDAGALETSAVQDGDEYVLNGSKNWVTNGRRAGIYLVFARTDKAKGSHGISAFIVERGTPGLVLGKPEDKMGLRGSDTIPISLTDLRIPLANRLGPEGEGFKVALSALDAGRIGVAAQALGVMRAAFEDAVRYAQQRVAFGGPLSKIQAIQFKLAEMERRVQCSRLLIRRAAWMRDTNQPFGRASAMAKLYATEAATWVTHQAIQIHGGYGYVKEYPVERYYRDARIMEIYEGASEIQRLVIARSLLKDGVAV
ncbi:MAG TPA: acyl-CoA dehydrogenase family protein [Candidatus Saccharimonadaceae bacterium]|jgi:alkylation response protein AidB-like acyl-CoA dehydrogenase|nr:acyl-CoA dehydrogenase family protein [Candidatus Saccharimonadaceae bacterium]